jgi:TonB family protein
MRSGRVLLATALCLLTFVPMAFSAYAAHIRIWLLTGNYMLSGAGQKDRETRTFSDSAELVSLTELALGPGIEFKTPVMNALMDLYNLASMEEVFFLERDWLGNRPKLSDTLASGNSAFTIELFPEKSRPQEVALRVIVSKATGGSPEKNKDPKKAARDAYQASISGGSQELILDNELQLRMGDPVLVVLPRLEKAYFMVVSLAEPNKASHPEARSGPASPKSLDLAVAPQPNHRVFPPFPEEMKQEAKSRIVHLRITADEKGAVTDVDVLAPVHPYIDFAVMQAVREWTFEPVLRNGRASRVRFEYDINLDDRNEATGGTREADKAAEGADAERLKAILLMCSDYSRKISELGLSFICEEHIQETHNYLRPPREWKDTFISVTEDVSDTASARWNISIMDPMRAERNELICDYQIIRRGGNLKEQRIILSANGKKLPDRSKLMESSRYAALMPYIEIIEILGAERHQLFRFQLRDEDRIRGKAVIVLDAEPGQGAQADLRHARFWVNAENGQVLKTEVYGIPTVGYEDVLREAVQLKTEPLFRTTHEFKDVQNNIVIPSHTAVLVEYPKKGMRPRSTKLKLDISYKKFKFFSVKTEEQIIR